MDGNKCKQTDGRFCLLVSSDPFLKLSCTNSDVLLVVFGLSGGIPWLKGTDRALCFFVNMKLKIEFIFFCGVHNLQKILTLCGITCTENYCIQPN